MYGPMMMNNMNGNFPPSGWQGFNPSQGPSKFHPMMVMGHSNGNFTQFGPPGFPNAPGNASVNSDNNTDRYSPNTTGSNNMRLNDRPSSGYQGYESNFGMNGSMGPGMMNGPGQYNNHQGMFCQPSYSDDRDEHKNNFPPQAQKQYYDGPNMGNMGNMGNNMMGNNNNNMMGMNRNFNNYNGGMNNGGQFMPMQQNGHPNGQDFYGRNSAGPSFGNNAGPPFPPNGRQMDHPSHPGQQQGGMYQQPQHPAEQSYNNGPSKSNKPPVLI